MAKKKKSSRNPKSGSIRQSKLPKGRRLWLFRILAVAVLPLFVLIVIEAGLNLGGFGYSAGYFLPSEKEGFLRENERFVWQFYSKNSNLKPLPLLVSKAKPKDTYRIVLLGGSAAMGTPEPAYGFGRILERMLEHRLPDLDVEVINGATRGINSYIVKRVAKECFELDPDLYLVYMGNNEAVGLHAPSPESDFKIPSLRVLQWQESIRALKLGQWVWNTFSSGRQPDYAAQETMEFFRKHRFPSESDGRMQVYENYASNVRSILRLLEGKGVPSLVSSVAVNLRDCSPLGSLHRDGLDPNELARWKLLYQSAVEQMEHGQYSEAIVGFREMLEIDEQYAEILFRIARCFEAIDKFDEGRRYYGLARDWDALPFRTHSEQNKLLPRIVDDFENAQFVDIATELSGNRLSKNGVPGREFFYDHVHLNIEGDYQVATILVPHILTKISGPGDIEGVNLTQDECKQALGFTKINESQLYASLNAAIAAPPFLDQFDFEREKKRRDTWFQSEFGTLGVEDLEKGKRFFGGAIAVAPEDWQLRYNFGLFFISIGDSMGAVRQFLKARELIPHNLAIRLRLANAYAGMGNRGEAIAELEGILKRDPGFEAAREGLAALSKR